MEKLDLGAKFDLTAISFNILDKPLHAHACTHAAWNAAKQIFSTKIHFQICAETHSLCFCCLALHSLPFLFLLWYTHLVLYIQACTQMQTNTHSFFHWPPNTHTHTYTERSRVLQMCVLICFQRRLSSCQCADSEFSTLSYEIRAGDIRAIDLNAWKSTQTHVHTQVKNARCVCVYTPLYKHTHSRHRLMNRWKYVRELKAY